MGEMNVGEVERGKLRGNCREVGKKEK